jgi:rubrerythrin
MYRGSSQKVKVMDDAAKIVERLKKTDATLIGLMREYRCGYSGVMRAILSQINKNQYKRLAKKKLAKGGVEHRFKKGHPPLYKHPKGSHPSPKTEFKKGHLPHNHKHVGTMRIHHDKKCDKFFREIKVSGILQGKHKWIPYAKYIYEQAHGKLPAGEFVIHYDGNSVNDNLDNLKAVTRREHLEIQMQRDPKMLKRCRKNASRAVKKMHARNRRIKKQALKIAEDYKDKKIVKAALNRIHGPTICWWECTGCGCEFQEIPSAACPKCSGLRFNKIEQRRKTG